MYSFLVLVLTSDAICKVLEHLRDKDSVSGEEMNKLFERSYLDILVANNIVYRGFRKRGFYVSSYYKIKEVAKPFVERVFIFKEKMSIDRGFDGKVS